MSPELKGAEQAYDGTKVDIFAMAQVLYTMKFANHAFWDTASSHYQKLMANPRAEMDARKLQCEDSFLDLVIGMFSRDPA